MPVPVPRHNRKKKSPTIVIISSEELCDVMKALKTDASARALVDDIEKHVPELMKQAAVPGLSLTLIRGAKVFWSQAFGVRSSVSQEPVTPDTVFEAASLSKPVFAYASLKLCEAGILDLDTPLTEYLPDPSAPDKAQLALVTMRHVLSHSTGFPNWQPKGESLRIHFGPGGRFSYSGEGYVYLNGQQVIKRMLYKVIGGDYPGLDWLEQPDAD